MLNQVTLLGRMGKDAVIKTFKEDSAVVEFSLATSEKWKDKAGEWQEKTQWHTVKQFGKASFLSRFDGKLVKGATVLATGKIEYRTYEDKDGVTKYITEINADTIRVVGGDTKPKSEGAQQERAPANTNSNDGGFANADDDLPF